MLIMAFLSLAFGVLAGRCAAHASSGLACNLREAMYENVQTFSFSNIDKFSTAGLVTRMTTDVTNVQNAYQMILRIAVRAPLMLICSMVMCFFISAQLSLDLSGSHSWCWRRHSLLIMLQALPRIFNEVFRQLRRPERQRAGKCHRPSAWSRPLSVRTMRTASSSKAADNLYRLFVKAESLLALNNPVMMLVVYGCILAHLLVWRAASSWRAT